MQESHVLYARITEAAAECDAKGASFLVLTLDRCGTYSGKKPWARPDDAFRSIQRMSQSFFQGLRRWFKRQGWAPLKREWVATTEAHRSGWPHQNIVIWHREFADWLREEQQAKAREGMSARDQVLVGRWLADVVTGAGWGIQSTAEAARNADAVASYVVKLAGENDQTVGEVSKLCQLPVGAPLRFRRLRSGVGFLPKRKRNPDYTGTLLRRTEWHGTPAVIPIHQLKDPAAIRIQSQVIEWEGDQFERESAERYRFRSVGKHDQAERVGLPPVTRWARGMRLATAGPIDKKNKSERAGGGNNGIGYLGDLRL